MPKQVTTKYGQMTVPEQGEIFAGLREFGVARGLSIKQPQGVTGINLTPEQQKAIGIPEDEIRREDPANIGGAGSWVYFNSKTGKYTLAGRVGGEYEISQEKLSELLGMPVKLVPAPKSIPDYLAHLEHTGEMPSQRYTERQLTSETPYTTGAGGVTPTKGRELPFPTTQAEMAEYQERHIFEGGKWYEGEAEGGVEGEPREGDMRQTAEGTYEIYNPFGEWTEVSSDQVQYNLQYGGRMVGGAVAPGDGGLPGDGTITGDPVLDQLLAVLQAQLEELQKRGQMIDPYAEITADKAAEFLAQAEREIDPYYATQLALAKDTLLTSLGYTREDIEKKEAEWERQYGRAVRTIGETMAEKGFALSGRRLEEEKELAGVTQRGLEEFRTTAGRAAGEAARTHAQLWGGAEVPTTTLPGMPTVTPGARTFGAAAGEKPLYELPSAFTGLVGEREWERRADVRSRQAELEQSYRLTEEAKQRRALL